jgi:hypothetical protein
MKIKHLKRYLIGIVMIAFLALLSGNAFADKAVTSLPSRDCNKAIDGSQCEYANNYMVVSPYWQVEMGGSYTFVAVSHSSLSGMASQIGVTVNAITSAGAAYDTAETFTVSAGTTKRVFIIPTNHASINSTTVTDAAFLAGASDFTYGHVRITPAASHPQLKEATNTVPKSGRGDGFRDTTMLTYWGSVIVEANTTGFAMEFIGDLNDSITLGGFVGGRVASGVNLN